MILRSLLIEATPYIYVPLLQHTPAAHYYSTRLHHTTPAHYCSTLLQHTSAKSQHYIYEPPQLPFENCCYIYELPNLRNKKNIEVTLAKLYQIFLGLNFSSAIRSSSFASIMPTNGCKMRSIVRCSRSCSMDFCICTYECIYIHVYIYIYIYSVHIYIHI